MEICTVNLRKNILENDDFRDRMSTTTSHPGKNKYEELYIIVDCCKTVGHTHLIANESLSSQLIPELQYPIEIPYGIHPNYAGHMPLDFGLAA